MPPSLHVFILVSAQAGVAEFLKTFKDFLPRQKAASFGVEQVIEHMYAGSNTCRGPSTAGT